MAADVPDADDPREDWDSLRAKLTLIVASTASTP